MIENVLETILSDPVITAGVVAAVVLIVFGIWLIRRIMTRRQRAVAELVETSGEPVEAARLAPEPVLELELGEFDLCRLVRREVEARRPQFEKAGVAFHSIVSGQIMVLADEEWMTRIINELLDNVGRSLTIEDTSGEVLVGVARTRVGDQRVARLTVTDTLAREGADSQLPVVAGAARAHGGAVAQTIARGRRTHVVTLPLAAASSEKTGESEAS